LSLRFGIGALALPVILAALAVPLGQQKEETQNGGKPTAILHQSKFPSLLHGV